MLQFENHTPCTQHVMEAVIKKGKNATRKMEHNIKQQIQWRGYSMGLLLH